jgi:cell division initiation protein
MKVAPVELQHVRLRRSPFGYNRADVDRLLEDVSASYKQVWLIRDSVQAEVDQLREELERSRERERLIGDALVMAQKIADTTISEAKKTADALVREAREKADALSKEARVEPERVRQEISRLRAIERRIHERLRTFLGSAQQLLEGDVEPAEESALPQARASALPQPTAGPEGNSAEALTS